MPRQVPALVALSYYKMKQSVIRRGEEEVCEGDVHTNIHGALSQPGRVTGGCLACSWRPPADIWNMNRDYLQNSTPRKTGDAHSCWEKLPTEGRCFHPRDHV